MTIFQKHPLLFSGPGSGRVMVYDDKNLICLFSVAAPIPRYCRYPLSLSYISLPGSINSWYKRQQQEERGQRRCPLTVENITVFHMSPLLFLCLKKIWFLMSYSLVIRKKFDFFDEMNFIISCWADKNLIFSRLGWTFLFLLGLRRLDFFSPFDGMNLRIFLALIFFKIFF